jgi:hypothetical protein
MLFEKHLSKRVLFFIGGVLMLSSLIITGGLYFKRIIASRRLPQFGEKDEIQTGKIEINLDEVKKIQEFVNNGHQPWRLDPEMVARSEALNFGFNNEDLKNLETVFENREKGMIHYKVIHKGEEYLLILVQPIIGEGKIWKLFEIKKLR